MAKNKYDDTPLWHDRKRILGMPISFTRYQFDTERLTVAKGLLTTVVDEILLYRILDIKETRTLGQKIFGVGTIHIFSYFRSISTTSNHYKTKRDIKSTNLC